ncbi:3-oxoacyl-[acyl-carrier protein] reductase [Paenibacillus favisporus]|uniref:3-oxoacyl-[acyl-carrier protein] reductase n=1 Tax=Paenibacillus favisporus TaxID=221028 RepID=A0ABV2F8N0_9BACL
MKTCLITGASRGIGRAIAIELSYKRGEISKFILVARDIMELENTKRLMSLSPNIETFVMDQADLKQVEEQLGIILENNTIDILINCAGFVEPSSLLETTVENWESTFTVNVGSVFLITREIVKKMKSYGGKIINISSTAGLGARPGWSAYSASKAAIINFSLTLSEELKEYGIKVYCISPGRCATDLRKKLAPDEDPASIMQPEEIAYVVNNLISKSGNSLDGQNIVVRQQINEKII